MFTSLRVHLCMVQSADESPRGGPHLGDSIHRVMGLDSLESLPRHAVMILLGPGRKEQTELERCRIGAVEYLRKPILTLHTIAFVVLSQLALSYSAFGPQLSFLPLILLRHSQTRPNPGWQPCHLYSHLELPASLLLMWVPCRSLCLPFFCSKKSFATWNPGSIFVCLCCISFSWVLFSDVGEERSSVCYMYLNKRSRPEFQPSMSSWNFWCRSSLVSKGVSIGLVVNGVDCGKAVGAFDYISFWRSSDWYCGVWSQNLQVLCITSSEVINMALLQISPLLCTSSPVVTFASNGSVRNGSVQTASVSRPTSICRASADSSNGASVFTNEECGQAPLVRLLPPFFSLTFGTHMVVSGRLSPLALC